MILSQKFYACKSQKSTSHHLSMEVFLEKVEKRGETAMKMDIQESVSQCLWLGPWKGADQYFPTKRTTFRNISRRETLDSKASGNPTLKVTRILTSPKTVAEFFGVSPRLKKRGILWFQCSQQPGEQGRVNDGITGLKSRFWKQTTLRTH